MDPDPKQDCLDPLPYYDLELVYGGEDEGAGGEEHHGQGEDGQAPSRDQIHSLATVVNKVIDYF